MAQEKLDTASTPTPTKPDAASRVISNDMPTSPNEVTDEPHQEQDVDKGIIVNASDMPPEAIPTAKKKKKKSKRPASKRGLNKPTGFEEFHADAPLTPEQYLESKEAFHADIPFVERILKAIQRFERARKMFPERRDVFYKYLAYGGLDVGPNMFGGGQNTEDMDKDQVVDVTAQASISDAVKQTILDPKQENKNSAAGVPLEMGSKMRSSDYAAKYVVDFEGTMRAFLSRHAPSIFSFDTQESVTFVTTTLERFMDFLLQHEVCTEYGAEVLRTRDLCRKAKIEVWQCIEAQRHLPGDFNIACSTLFGGSYAQNYDGETFWGPDDTEGGVFVGLTPEQATQIMGFAVAGAASEDVYARYLDIATGDSQGNDFKIVTIIQDHGFEITRIEPPSKDCLKLYRENTTEFRPVGRVHAKFFKNPNAPPEDLTPEEQALMASTTIVPDNTEDYTFFIESNPILSFLQPGMRIEATIYQLNCGIWFFDQVIRVLPSFDLWIENEVVMGWKEPRPMAGIHRSVWNVGWPESEEANATEPVNPNDVQVDADTNTEGASTFGSANGENNTTAAPVPVSGMADLTIESQHADGPTQYPEV